MTPAGVALIGTGFIGPVHAEALRRLGRPLVGVLASTPEKGAAVARTLGAARAYRDLDELLADAAAGSIHITSPNRHHYEQCRRALDAGKHIVCEKPLALNVKESSELTALAARASVAAAVCYNIRFYPLCLEARARIASGELGDVYHVTGSYTQDWLLHDTDFNWRLLGDEGGALRAVADIGTHWLDLAQFVTGLDIVEVCADLQTALPVRRRPIGSVETFQGKMSVAQATEPITIDTEDYGAVLLRFAGGARGCVTVSQVTAGRKNSLRLTVAGSKGSLAWDSERPNELWLGYRDRPNELLLRDPALLSAAARSSTNYPGGHNEGFPDTFKQLFRTFYEAVDRGDPGTARWYPSFADGHRELMICHAVRESHCHRRWSAVQEP